MKATGPQSAQKKTVIRLLEKRFSETRQPVWKTIARVLGGPRRNEVRVNAGKIGIFGKLFPGKTLVVPGKVLSAGNVEGAVRVVAYQFSEQAAEKIRKSKGQVVELESFLESKSKASDIVLVK